MNTCASPPRKEADGLVDGVLEMNSNEKKRYGTRKEQSGDGD